MTWLELLNLVALQWLGLRLYRWSDLMDPRSHGFGLLVGVLPLSGWWGRYRHTGWAVRTATVCLTQEGIGEGLIPPTPTRDQLRLLEGALCQQRERIDELTEEVERLRTGAPDPAPLVCPPLSAEAARRLRDQWQGTCLAASQGSAPTDPRARFREELQDNLATLRLVSALDEEPGD